MRPLALLASAAFLLVPLAGCLGGNTATAKDLLPTARGLAQSWRSDAALAGIATVELKELPAEVKDALAKDSGASDNPQAQLVQYSDPYVGDGRAPAWVFGYRSGDRDLLLVLDAAGSLLARHESSAGHDAGRALGDFAIDSDRAMQLAARHNATFERLEGHAAVATLALVPGPANPVWVLVITANFMEGSDRDSAFAMVDADSGNVTTQESFTAGMSAAFGGGSSPGSPYYDHGNQTFVRTESGSDAGTLTLASPDAGNPFQVDDAGHGSLRIQLSLPASAPPTQATATVTGPDGRTVKVTFAAGLTGNAPAVATLEKPMPGAYKVDVHLDSGVVQQYGFSWCAPGSRVTEQDPSSPCAAASGGATNPASVVTP